ncbi:hypothetical protein B4U79_02320, partial [Dinothrombium tinctorium]
DLKELSKKSKKKTSKLLKSTDKKICTAISEAAANVLHGNVPLKENRKNQLKKFKKELRKLSKKSTVSFKEKKKIINQKGGALLPLLLP